MAAFTEGPTAGISVGFLSKLGYMDMHWGYFAHVFGDLSADYLYYSLGYFGGVRILPKVSRFFGFSISEVKKAESIFLKNQKKIIIFGKLTHFVGLPVLIACGVMRYSWWKFGLFDLLATIIKSALLVLIGYYFGEIWKEYSNFVLDITIGVTLLIVIPIGYFLYKRRQNTKNKA